MRRHSTNTTVKTVSGATSAVFINEIHYDNPGIDFNEAIEIAAPAGTNLTGECESSMK